MAYQFKTYEKAVGAFVISTMMFIALFTIVALSNVFEKLELFIHENTYTTEFRYGHGLKKNLKVLANGFEIGEVIQVSPIDRHTFNVLFKIEKEFAPWIKSDSVVLIDTPIIGGNSLIIKEGSSQAMTAKPKSRLYSSDSKEGREILERLHNETLPPGRLDQIAYTLNKLIEKLEDEDGSLQGILSEVHVLLARVNSDENTGSLRSILYKFDRLMSNLETASKSTDEALKNLDKVLVNLQKVRLLGGEKKTTRK